MTAKPTGTPPGIGAQSPLQQGPAPAGDRANGVDGAATARLTNRARIGDIAWTRPVRCPCSYGFMEDPDVPEALAQARDQGLPLDPDDLTYFLGRETIIGHLARTPLCVDGA